MIKYWRRHLGYWLVTNAGPPRGASSLFCWLLWWYQACSEGTIAAVWFLPHGLQLLGSRPRDCTSAPSRSVPLAAYADAMMKGGDFKVLAVEELEWQDAELSVGVGNKQLRMDKDNGKSAQIPRVVITNSKQDVKKIDVRDLDVWLGDCQRPSSLMNDSAQAWLWVGGKVTKEVRSKAWETRGHLLDTQKNGRHLRTEE